MYRMKVNPLLQLPPRPKTKAAFPNIVSSDIFYAGILAGSLFDLEEMQRELEELEELEED